MGLWLVVFLWVHGVAFSGELGSTRAVPVASGDCEHSRDGELKMAMMRLMVEMQAVGYRCSKIDKNLKPQAYAQFRRRFSSQLKSGQDTAGKYLVKNGYLSSTGSRSPDRTLDTCLTTYANEVSSQMSHLERICPKFTADYTQLESLRTHSDLIEMLKAKVCFRAPRPSGAECRFRPEETPTSQDVVTKTGTAPVAENSGTATSVGSSDSANSGAKKTFSPSNASGRASSNASSSGNFGGGKRASVFQDSPECQKNADNAVERRFRLLDSLMETMLRECPTEVIPSSSDIGNYRTSSREIEATAQEKLSDIMGSLDKFQSYVDELLERQRKALNVEGLIPYCQRRKNIFSLATRLESNAWTGYLKNDFCREE